MTDTPTDNAYLAMHRASDIIRAFMATPDYYRLPEAARHPIRVALAASTAAELAAATSAPAGMRTPVDETSAARIAAAAPQLHRALADLVALVNKHDIGDDDAESEPVVDRARAALRAAS